MAPMNRSTRLLIGGPSLSSRRSSRGSSCGRAAANASPSIWSTQFPDRQVEKRPTPEVFEVVDATLAGVTKPAILAKEPSRVAWSVTVPEDAWLKVQRRAAGSSVDDAGRRRALLRRVGGTIDEVLNVVVNPSGNPSDRQWQEIIARPVASTPARPSIYPQDARAGAAPARRRSTTATATCPLGRAASSSR